MTDALMRNEWTVTAWNEDAEGTITFELLPVQVTGKLAAETTAACLRALGYDKVEIMPF